MNQPRRSNIETARAKAKLNGDRPRRIRRTRSRKSKPGQKPEPTAELIYQHLGETVYPEIITQWGSQGLECDIVFGPDSEAAITLAAEALGVEEAVISNVIQRDWAQLMADGMSLRADSFLLNVAN